MFIFRIFVCKIVFYMNLKMICLTDENFIIYELLDNFITQAEWRDEQINLILDDEN